MNPTVQALFETYGEALLAEIGHGFDEKRLETWMKSFPLDEHVRYQILDGLLDYYQHWAAAAFSVGLRLGLSLFDCNVRRLRPEEG